MSEENKESQNEETEEVTETEENNEEVKEEAGNKGESEEKGEEKGLEEYVSLSDFKKEFADKIRKEEKDKLYPQIEKTKEQLKDLEEEKNGLEKKVQEYEDKNLSIEEKNSKKYDELIEANKNLEEQVQKISNDAAKEIYNIKLEGAKKEVLAKYGDDIIEEMVDGETVEEIYEKAEKAHEKYMEIRGKEEERLKKKKQREKTGSKIDPGSSEKVETTNLDDLDNAKPENWEKIKNDLLEESLGI